MKDIFTSMEILLVANTKFSSREFLGKNENKPSNNNGQHHKFAEACWNGMIPAMLPEFFNEANPKLITMWQVEECRHILYVNMGEENNTPDPAFTINPFAFLRNLQQN